MALQRKSTTVDAALAQTDDSVSAQPNKQDGMDHELPTSLIHSGLEIEFPAHHTTSVSESLAKSSLDWKGIADHAFLICNSRFASKDELDLSQRLLEECEQNRMQASRLLLTSLLDSH